MSVNYLSLIRPYVYKSRDSCFLYSKDVKKTAEAFQSKPIELKAYKRDESICPVKTVIEYIKASEQYRKLQKLILGDYKYGAMTKQTACLYIKQTLKAAGINTTFFSTLSTRQSTSSKTFMKEGPLTDIKKNGGRGMEITVVVYKIS